MPREVSLVRGLEKSKRREHGWEGTARHGQQSMPLVGEKTTKDKEGMAISTQDEHASAFSIHCPTSTVQVLRNPR